MVMIGFRQSFRQMIAGWLSSIENDVNPLVKQDVVADSHAFKSSVEIQIFLEPTKDEQPAHARRHNTINLLNELNITEYCHFPFLHAVGANQQRSHV
jgi:hypothetical protein